MLRDWRRLFPDPADEQVFREVVAAYSAPSRHYHNIKHIRDCLELLGECTPELQYPRETEIAIWFHDVVYDPTRSDNEAHSADLAEDRLREMGEAELPIGTVRALILDTRHAAPPSSPDGAHVSDIDLSILGRPPAVFDAYDTVIRLEYSHVPEKQYRAGRTAVLRSFLDRDSIYSTHRWRARFEAAARENLRRAIARLAEAPN